MREIVARAGQAIELGKRGENFAACVVFDISAWQKTYGEGKAQLIHQRNGDKHPYPCVVEADGNLVRWPICGADTAVAGRGYAELQYWVDETIVKSVTYTTSVEKAMGAAGESFPAPIKSWLEKLLRIGSESEANALANALIAKEAAEDALEAAEAAEKAAKEAQEAAAGFCTEEDAKAFADAAERNAKAYADQQIMAAIGVAIGGSY